MKRIKLKTITRAVILVFLFSFINVCHSFAQVPTTQDCIGAIPICSTTYQENNVYIGTGNYTSEINASNCIFPENNSVWYILTIQTSGNLCFTLSPSLASANFDWAVYNLTGYTCANIFTNPALMVGCNADVTPGNTGPNGLGGSQNGPVIAVLAGQTYVICVNNTSASASGFILDFTCSTAQITDNIPPHMSTITLPIACNATSLTVNFSENVLCTPAPATFWITDVLSVVHTVTAVASGNCTAGGLHAISYTLTFTPPILIAGPYVLHMSANSVTDLCGNVAAAGTLPFNVAGVQCTNGHQNSTCACDGRVWANVTSGLGPYTYAWTPSSATTRTVSNLCAGTYTCTVHGASGCPGATIVTVSQNSTLWDTAILVSNGCSANTAVIAANDTGGTAPYTYLWSVSAATTQTVSNVGVGTYTVTVTDAAGCTRTATVTVGAGSGMTLTPHATNVNCSNATNGVVWVTVTGGTTPYTYIWSSSGNTTATVSNLTSGNYTVTVTDAHGCTGTSISTINIVAGISLTTDSVNANCTSAASGQCRVIVNGNLGPYTYSWTPSGGFGPTASNLAAGNYTVTVTDSHGCTLTHHYTITQVNNLVATINDSANVLCNGGASGIAGVGVSNGSGNYTYTWTPSGGTSATASNLAANTYTVSVHDNSGCTATATITLTAPSALAVVMTSHGSSCNLPNGYAVATPSGGTTGYTYAWSTVPVQNSTTATNLISGTFRCTVTDANGCTIVDSTSVGTVGGPTATITASTNVSCFGGNDGTITASGSGSVSPYTFSWNTIPVQNTATATNLINGTYTVTVTDSTGCGVTATATITQPTKVTITVAGAITICSGQPATITAVPAGGTPPYTFLWNNASTTSSQVVNPLSTTTYTCTATDANGCPSAPQSVIVTVRPPLSITITGGNVTLCPGQSTSLFASGSGGNGGPYGYTWTPFALGNPINVSPSATTTYTCSVSDGCTTTPSTATYVVSVANPPTMNFHITPHTGCVPLLVEATDASLLVPSGSRYLWDFDGDGTDTARNTSFLVTHPGSHSVTMTITTPLGCVYTMMDTNVINAWPKPTAIFTADPLSTEVATAFINFTNHSVGSIAWNWDFGDDHNNNSNLYNPFHKYNSVGLYTVTLAAVNNYGCIDTALLNLKIKEDFAFFIPSAFSPGGDGLNEYFGPQGIGITDFTMNIYDRFGEIIYTTTDLSAPWDGKVISKPAPEGVYVYWIQISDVGGEKHQYTGKITLIR